MVRRKLLGVFFVFLCSLHISYWGLGLREASRTFPELNNSKITSTLPNNLETPRGLKQRTIAVPEMSHVTFQKAQSQWGNSLIKCQSGGFAIIGTSNYHVFLIRTDNIGSHIWNKTYPPVENRNYGLDLSELNDGFMLYTGYFAWGQMPSCGGSFLVRTDVNGIDLWNRTYNPPGPFDYCQDSAGDFTACQNGDFVLAEINENLPGQSRQIWVLRINNIGTPLWNRTFDPGVGHDFCTEIIECQSENLVLVGFSSQSWILGLDKNGSTLWSQTYPSEVQFKSLVECRDGGFAIIGTKTNNVTGVDVLLIKTDATGNELWNQTFGGFGDEVGYDLVETASGDFAITGYTSSTLNGDDDLLFIQTNYNGTITRERIYGGVYNDYGSSLVDMGNNEFTITGATLSYGNSEHDLWLVFVFNTEITPIPTFPLYIFIVVIAIIPIAILISLGVYIFNQKRKG